MCFYGSGRLLIGLSVFPLFGCTVICCLGIFVGDSTKLCFSTKASRDILFGCLPEETKLWKSVCMPEESTSLYYEVSEIDQPF